ncbi:chromate transporter [Thermoleptolyngbya sp. C42_A2020_037]|uniref:chromate transporter n=1 Tax=Thermoleptolyngbya sp. C42_A2020_037 TaxID=2747799 RepID=UPI0019EA8189|nr:chromate transporter [Thermoleptolyngbya sp. C42_A2020_037]MBF2085532.1 chromate transporter [Thermoleptolyngbya sp. C42_A2020_037]
MSQPSQPLEGFSDETLPYDTLSPAAQRQRLGELAGVFLKLGAIAFGGPAAHIAMMDDEIVTRRRWLSREKLLDFLGITNLIPGPNSTELAIYLGYDRAGWRGLVLAGTCFILPAMLIVWALAAVYVRYQAIPQVEWLLYGVKAVVIAIIVQALWKLGKKALKDWPTWAVAIAVIALFATGLNEIALLLLGGVAVMLIKNLGQREPGAPLLLFPLSLLAQTSAAPAASPTNSPTWGSVFLLFLKIGAVLYGSGYVLLAFLEREFVQRTGWLTSQQILDAVAVGQVTPGPVFTTATFIGYLLAGNAGAVAATIAIFLPAFALVLIINPFLPKLRQSRWVSGFLDGVNAASLGLMAVVTWTLVRAAVVDWVTVILALLSLVAVFRLKVNSVWLVLGGAIVGLLAQSLT